MSLRALVVTGFGINCEEETAAAFRLAGASVEIAHLNDLFAEKISLLEFDTFVLPGGFSFGDDLGSGRMLAQMLRHKKLKSGKKFFDVLIDDFLAHGKSILGICNGFQALMQSGLLPNTGGKFEQEGTLAKNLSMKFEDRFVHLASNFNRPVITRSGRVLQQTLFIPVRHGEGRVLFASDDVQQQVQRQNLATLFYANAKGEHTNSYPENPNGSTLAIAGLSDISGQVFGLMPHPEACLYSMNRPDFALLQRSGIQADDFADGYYFFKSYVEKKGIFV